MMKMKREEKMLYVFVERKKRQQQYSHIYLGMYVCNRKIIPKQPKYTKSIPIYINTTDT